MAMAAAEKARATNIWAISMLIGPQRLVIQLSYDKSGVRLTLPINHPTRFQHVGNEHTVPLAVLPIASLPGSLRGFVNAAQGFAFCDFVSLVETH